MTPLLPGVYTEAFRDEFTLRDNPIQEREVRRDGRRPLHRLILLVCLLTMFFACWITVSIYGVAAREWGVRHIPFWLGSTYGVMLVLAFSGFHALFLSHAAHRRTRSFFMDEYRRNTLAALLSTSFTPFQLILQAAVHPFKEAMLIALAGLPFYAIACNLGGITIADVLALYLLFAMMAFSPPRWRVPAFGQMRPEEIAKKRKSGRGNTAWEVGCVVAILGYMASIFLSAIFGLGWISNLLSPLGDLVSPQLKEILPTFFLGWPLLFARWLITPLAFFAISLPPVVFAIPLYAASQIQNIWQSSMYLRVEEARQIEMLWDLPAYWRFRRTYLALFAFAIVGYLWKPYVESKVTASLITVRLPQPGQDLAGLLWLCGVWAAVLFWERIYHYRRANSDRFSIMSLEYGKRELAFSLQALIAIYGLYLIACLLGGRAPLPGPALDLLTPLLATTLAGALIVRPFPIPRLAYVFLLVLPFAFWAAPGAEFVAALSPLAGIMSLSPHFQRIANGLMTGHIVIPGWQTCAAVTASAGLLANLAALLFRRTAPAAVQTDPSDLPDKPLPEQNLEFVPRGRRKWREKKEYPAAARLIRWVQGWADNAVAIKELRVLLRGRLSAPELVALACALVSPVAGALLRPDIAAAIMGEPVLFFFGITHMQSAQLSGGLAIVWMIVCSAILPFFAVGLSSTAFGKERDRSTLGFVLTTPMPTGAILWGKMLGLMLQVALMLALFSILIALFTVPVVMPGGAAHGFAGWLLIAPIPVLLTCAAGMLGLAAATLVRKEADATALGMFAYIGFVIFSFYVNYRLHELWSSGSPLSSQAEVGLWLICLAVLTLLTSLACLAIAYARIDYARRGYVLFGVPVKK